MLAQRQRRWPCIKKILGHHPSWFITHFCHIVKLSGIRLENESDRLASRDMASLKNPVETNYKNFEISGIILILM